MGEEYKKGEEKKIENFNETGRKERYQETWMLK
jgi:hypothetical protein